MIIHLDFETYFDSKYSLPKMPTILYVRDPRFYMLGVSVAIGDGPHIWMDEAQFVDFADTVDWAHTEVNAYNNAFDSCILTQRFNIFPGRYMCSQSLARGLLPLEKYNLRNVAVALGMDPKKDGLKSGSKEVTPELIEYAKHDNELSRQIYKLLLPFIPDKELDVIHQTVKKAVEPVLVLDREVLTEVLEKHISDREACIAASGYSEADLVSNQKFSAIIRSLGLEPPQSESKTTGEISDCFAKNEDAFVTFMLENPQYKHIWDARLQAKSNINVTRTQRLLDVAASGTMPMPQLYCGAHTGRSSGTDFLNVQNLPNKRVSRMREAFRAPSGQHIVVVDSSQIELRMNMWFCGQHDKLELLRSGGDIYKAEAASQFNIDETDVNSQQRQYGKIIQLGCIAEDTLVVASSDRINAILVPIQDITTDHWVWDGVEWVSHLGSIFSGEKECYSKAGFIMTPDHKVLCEETWVPFQSLVQNDGMYRLALETGSENLQSLGFSSELVEEWSIFSSIVRVVSKITEFTTTIYERVSLLDVMCVLRSNLGTTKRTIVGMLTSCQTMPNGLDCSIEYPRLLTDAVTQMTPGTRIMAEEVSVCARSGGRIGENFLRILLRYLDGMAQACSWIGRIMRRGIFRGIFGLLRGARICRTDEPSQFLPRRTKTYDIAFAGPRRRFTIWSAGSALQVHNCGYRMGAKVFRQFCAAGPLGCDPIYLTDEEAWRNIYTYRQGNANVAAMWKTLDKAIYSMAMANNEFPLPEVPILTFGPGYIVLPSGRRLKYPNLSHTEAGWVFEIPSLGKKRNYRFLHGGTLLENIIQAMARDVVFYQELEIAKKYRTVATTHDEVLFLAPIEEAEEALAFAIDVFSVTPEWAPGLPLSAEGAHAPHYCK